jgi:hypothetical protein
VGGTSGGASGGASGSASGSASGGASGSASGSAGATCRRHGQSTPLGETLSGGYGSRCIRRLVRRALGLLNVRLRGQSHAPAALQREVRLRVAAGEKRSGALSDSFTTGD